MKDTQPFEIIAKIRTDFPTKFGIPRQSGIVKNLKGKIVFEEKYRNDDALRGIEGYSHLWLLWKFSESVCKEWSPTVRPPRLGGNKRVGVFATRSPFRPNPIGLSSVKLEGIEKTEEGTVLYVSGADMLDGTPIYDIKPYIPFTDSHSDAEGGFADEVSGKRLEIEFADGVLQNIPTDMLNTLCDILADDPRPAYQDDEKRVYSFEFANLKLKFSVKENLLTLLSADEILH